MGSFAVCAALACFLVGCAQIAPSDTPAVTVPATWSSNAALPTKVEAPTPLAQWWQRFHDPQLTSLITQALAANTDLHSARVALQQSRALRDLRAAALLARLDATGSAQRARSAGNEAGNSFALGFDASWEGDWFGGNRSALAASQADAQAAQANLEQVQVSLAAEVAVSYIELRGLQARLQIAQDNLNSQAETLQIARWRTQAGLASSLDAEQAVAAYEQTQAQIPALNSTLEQAFNGLAVLLAQPAAEVRKRLQPAPIPEPAKDLVLAIPAQTLRQRPDLRAAEYRVSAALQRVAQADAARYPGFQLGGSLSLRAPTLASLASGAAVASSLLAGLSAPLFDGGAALAQLHAQNAALEQARIAYQATVLAALRDVEDSLVSLRGNRLRLERLQAAADAAANADLMARQRYRSGLIDFRSVLDTQRTLLTTQDGVASTRASLASDHVRLYKALGGGWMPDAVDQGTD